MKLNHNLMHSQDEIGEVGKKLLLNNFRHKFFRILEKIVSVRDFFFYSCGK